MLHAGRGEEGLRMSLRVMIAEVHTGWIQSSALDRMTLNYCLPMKGDIDSVAGHMVWNKEQGYRCVSLTQKKKA